VWAGWFGLSDIVGRVVGVFRYPVKTMLGEGLQRAYVGENGIIGDRAYAVEFDDEAIGRVKNRVKYAKLIRFRARYVEEPEEGYIPPAVIKTPSGEEIRTDNPGINGLLSRELGMGVSLVKSLQTPFHDSHPIHLITTATLEYMRSKTGQDFTYRRFRPNILVEARGGLVEDRWVGATLMIGDGVMLSVRKRCRRCFFTTLAQPPDIPENKNILKFVEEFNEGMLGVNCSVAGRGFIRVGDEVRVVNR